VKGKDLVMLVEAVTFAAGLLMVSVSAYMMASEAIRKAKQSL
jgi:hypothetical protein